MTVHAIATGVESVLAVSFLCLNVEIHGGVVEYRRLKKSSNPGFCSPLCAQPPRCQIPVILVSKKKTLLNGEVMLPLHSILCFSGKHMARGLSR